MTRTRRGSRIGGAHLCAGIAALLLLLSVSVLHSRLGSASSASRNSSFRLGLGFQIPTPQTPTSAFQSDQLRDSSDATEIEASDDNGAGDDRIDELDALDEEIDEDTFRVGDEAQILRGAGIEDDDDDDSEFQEGSGNGKKDSGLFWDHVTGVMRQAFDKRSSAVYDVLEGANLNSEEDRGEVAFTTDDQPLDEYVGKKLDEVKEVEDALLLKKGGGRPALLRDGWAPWFEKKGDFLKKDRMFRSNLEALNPLNNPLLQDPDMPGVTTLTKGDKLLLKMMWREIENTPFGGVQSVRSAVKKITERRTLNNISADNADRNVTNSGTSKPQESKTVDARLVNPLIHLHKRRRRETLQTKKDFGLDSKKLDTQDGSSMGLNKHIYADGQRWGYFPGLDPHLSFSEFMDQFFGQKECSVRIHMVWNTPSWTYGVRHQRSLESIFYHHRDACVAVLSETVDLDFFADFVNEGFKIAAVMPNLDELLKDTPTHVFASVWHKWRKIKHYFIHYSELMRLAALYKYGGIYLDFDVIVLKPLDSFKNSIALEDQLTGSSTFNGAVMAFKRRSPFIMECLREFYSTYDENSLRWNGADLLTRVVKRLVSRKTNSGVQFGLKIEPSFAFFPLNSRNIIRYFAADADETERAHQDMLFRKILDESSTFHFWNSVTSALVPEANSLVERLINHYCLRCLEVL